MAGKRSIGKIVKYYALVVLFPTFTVSTIYLDWNHTRLWKIAESQKQAASSNTA